MGILNLVGGSNITLSQSGNSISFVAAAPGGTVSMYPAIPLPIVTSAPLAQTVSGGAGGGSTASSVTLNGWVWPIALEGALRANNIRMAEHHSLVSGATSVTGTYRHFATFAMYSRSVSTMNLVSSWSHSFQFSHASTNTSASGTWAWTLGYGNSVGSASSSSSTSLSANFSIPANAVSSQKMFAFNATNASFEIPAGQYFGLMIQSTNTGGAASHGSMSAIAMNSLSVAGSFVSELGDATANITTPWPLLGQISMAMTTNSNAGTTQAMGASSFTGMPSSIHVSLVVTTVASANTASVNQWPFIQMMTRAD